MSEHAPQEQELVSTIRAAWVPGSSDPEAFHARLRGRLRGRRRRRSVLVVAVAAAVLAVGVSHLLGGSPAPPVVEPEARPLAVVEPPTDGVFWSQALDHDQRSFALPGAYGALDTLFLQPRDQEM